MKKFTAVLLMTVIFLTASSSYAVSEDLGGKLINIKQVNFSPVINMINIIIKINVKQESFLISLWNSMVFYSKKAWTYVKSCFADDDKLVTLEDVNKFWSDIAGSAAKDEAGRIFNEIKNAGKLEMLFAVLNGFVDRDYFINNNNSENIVLYGSRNNKALTFCKEYPKNYGFVDKKSLFNALKALYEKYFSVRSYRRFSFTANYNSAHKEEIINSIAQKSFFEHTHTQFDKELNIAFINDYLLKFFSDAIEENRSVLTDELIKAKYKRKNIQDILNLKLREFLKNKFHETAFIACFKVSEERPYEVLILWHGKKLKYFAGDENFILLKRADLENTLDKNITFNFTQNEMRFFLPLWELDKNLADNITIDECLEIFCDQVIKQAGIKAQTKDESFKLDGALEDEPEEAGEDLFINLRHLPLLKKFIEAGAIEQIISVNDFNDKDFFSSGSMVFCKVFENSRANFRLMNFEKLKQSLKSLYHGELKTSSENFVFKISPAVTDWTKTLMDISENSMFKIQDIEPMKSIRKIYRADNGVLRFLFRTNHEGLHLAVFQKLDGNLSLYLASENGKIFEVDQLFKLLSDKKFIERIGSNTAAFYIQKSNRSLQNAGIDECIDIFIKQVIK